MKILEMSLTRTKISTTSQEEGEKRGRGLKLSKATQMNLALGGVEEFMLKRAARGIGGLDRSDKKNEWKEKMKNAYHGGEFNW